MGNSRGGRRPRPLLDGLFRKACDFCVRSKRACNGGGPCYQCSKRGMDCTYSQRRKSGPRGKGGPRQGRPGKDRQKGHGLGSKVPDPQVVVIPLAGMPSKDSQFGGGEEEARKKGNGGGGEPGAREQEAQGQENDYIGEPLTSSVLSKFPLQDAELDVPPSTKRIQGESSPPFGVAVEIPVQPSRTPLHDTIETSLPSLHLSADVKVVPSWKGECYPSTISLVEDSQDGETDATAALDITLCDVVPGERTVVGGALVETAVGVKGETEICDDMSDFDDDSAWCIPIESLTRERSLALAVEMLDIDSTPLAPTYAWFVL